MDDNNIKDDFIEKSGFNTAKAIGLSLVRWFEECNERADEGRYPEWYGASLNAYKNIDCRLNSEERKNCGELISELDAELNEYINKTNSPISRIFTIRTKLPKMIFNFELIIRRFADVHGMLNPPKDDSGL